jgi:hypothetical protein
VWRIDVRAGDGNAQTIEVSDATGEAHVARAQNDNGVATTMRRLHEGVGQNILWRIVIGLAGLAPAILGVTGLFMWLKPKSPAAPNRS